MTGSISLSQPNAARNARVMARLLCGVVLAVVTACYDPRPPTGAPCDDDQGCPVGQRCLQNRCGVSGSAVDAPDVPGDGRADAPAIPVDAAVDAPPDAPPPGFCLDVSDCATMNPCEEMECTDNRCVASLRPDGASCGAAASRRCCSGTCVDISSDESNCGGCGQACAPGRTCESVAVTTACGLAPPETSGRCTCAAANAECPDGQICRNQTPAANRCTPTSVTNCAPGQVYVDVDYCPRFCRY